VKKPPNEYETRESEREKGGKKKKHNSRHYFIYYFETQIQAILIMKNMPIYFLKRSIDIQNRRRLSGIWISRNHPMYIIGRIS